MSNLNDFVIENGVLVSYDGHDKDIVIPEGVTRIGEWAFGECDWITSVVIPEGVTHIEDQAFYSCTKLRKVVLPSTLVSIGSYAFDCGHDSKLEFLSSIPSECKFGEEVFGNYCYLPDGLWPFAEQIYSKLPNKSLKKYILNKYTWKQVEPSCQLEIFRTRQESIFKKSYEECIQGEQAVNLANQIALFLENTPNEKDCAAIALFMTKLSKDVPADLLKQIYDALNSHKCAVDALDTINQDSKLMKKMAIERKVEESADANSPAFDALLQTKGKSEKDIIKLLKDYYALTYSDLPVLKYADGSFAPNVVLAYLLTAHEKIEKISYRNSSVLIAEYKNPGVKPEIAKIVAMLDQESLQKALRSLADQYIGQYTPSKKKYLSYPICRYADEDLMIELTGRAPSWATKNSGKNAPFLFELRCANYYSNTRAAMLFADKYGDLEGYASLRGTTANDLRDRNISDVSLNALGEKTYDLGNQSVVVRLQDDLSFLVELPTGKTAKSLPKKGADEEKYKAANTDFSAMKKNVKRIFKNRNQILFKEFLEGKSSKVDDWKTAYLDNALLKRVARLLVWVQSKNTFTVADDGLVGMDGSVYALNSKPIKLAHPMEMKPEEVSAWQKYFTSKNLKQPFEQVWEPVVDPKIITIDRYKDCMIPYYRFSGQEKHGIKVVDENFHETIRIYLNDCDTVVERIDDWHHQLDVNNRFEITSFKFEKYTRKTNHIVGYLDKITVMDRITRDDVTVVNYIATFTLAQIMECIRVAQESKANNVLALLLDYKNIHFYEFDSMDEFTLDF